MISVSIGQKRQLTDQNLHNENAKCDMRGDTNFKGDLRPFETEAMHLDAKPNGSVIAIVMLWHVLMPVLSFL